MLTLSLRFLLIHIQSSTARDPRPREGQTREKHDIAGACGVIRDGVVFTSASTWL
jgi:hypothetical protein